MKTEINRNALAFIMDLLIEYKYILFVSTDVVIAN